MIFRNRAAQIHQAKYSQTVSFISAVHRDVMTKSSVTGSVKFFNAAKGFGFIAPEDGGKDVFVPAASITASGLARLKAGQRVSFDLEPDAKGPKAGYVPIQRLNRTEYGNAVRDLLALNVDVTALLPPDDAGYGFDNIADLLGVSPVLLERYLSAAWKISSLAIGDHKIDPAVQTYRIPPELSQYKHVEGLPLGTRGGYSVVHNFPLDAEYVLRPGLWSNTTHWVKGIEYPTDFPIKIMGRREPRLVQTIVEIVQRHSPDFDATTVEMRTSKKNNYLSVTCTVRATSREQLDALYRDLCDHPAIVMVL
jgi:putative lipoic acid-binding regulatory protein/cold shock CspA family protein